MRPAIRFLVAAATGLLCVHIAAAFDVGPTPVSGVRPLLVILSHAPDEPLAHEDSWYRERVFGAGRSPSIYQYFRKQSDKRFWFSEAGVYNVVNDESDELNSNAGVKADQSNREKIARRAVYLAHQAGFDFVAYDSNNDGKVTNDELTVLVIERSLNDDLSKADHGTGGATTKGRCMTVGSKQVCSRVAIAGYRSELGNYAHELSHTIDPITYDLYGARNRCNSYDATLMSCTGGGTPEGERIVYLDPYHRARMGWQGRALSASYTDIGSTFRITQVGNEPYEPEVLTVQGPTAGESISFEIRRRSPLDNVTSSNAYFDYRVFAWYAWLNEKDRPQEILALAPPKPRTRIWRWPGLDGPAPGSDYLPPFRVDPLDRLALAAQLVRERGTDGSVFVLAPVRNCELDPFAYDSRGRTADLYSGEYEVLWANRTRSTFYIESNYDVLDGYLHYDIRIDNSSGQQRECSLQ